MKVLNDFFQVARDDFKKSGVGGEFKGLNMVGDQVFFVHSCSQTLIKDKSTLWPNAASFWEGIHKKNL